MVLLLFIAKKEKKTTKQPKVSVLVQHDSRHKCSVINNAHSGGNPFLEWC